MVAAEDKELVALADSRFHHRRKLSVDLCDWSQPSELVFRDKLVMAADAAPNHFWPMLAQPFFQSRCAEMGWTKARLRVPATQTRMDANDFNASFACRDAQSLTFFMQ